MTQTLDLSWNGFGNGSAHPSRGTATPARALARALFTNNTLVHLNLNHNSLNDADCTTLAAALTVRTPPSAECPRPTSLPLPRLLQFNHTLLGLHMEGNSAWVDAAGFLLLQSQHEQPDPMPQPLEGTTTKAAATGINTTASPGSTVSPARAGISRRTAEFSSTLLSPRAMMSTHQLTAGYGIDNAVAPGLPQRCEF